MYNGYHLGKNEVEGFLILLGVPITDYNYVLKYLIWGHIEKAAILDKTEITTQMREKTQNQTRSRYK